MWRTRQRRVLFFARFMLQPSSAGSSSNADNLSQIALALWVKPISDGSLPLAANVSPLWVGLLSCHHRQRAYVIWFSRLMSIISLARVDAPPARFVFRTFRATTQLAGPQSNASNRAYRRALARRKKTCRPSGALSLIVN